MTKRNQASPETIAAQAGGAIDAANGGLVPPIQPSTTFIRDRDYNPTSQQYIYGRDDSAIVRTAEDVLTKLENADDTLLFPSGMAAIACVMRTVENGGTILFQSQIYWGTTKWIREFCLRRNIKPIEMDCSDAEALETQIANSRPDIVFVETPSNPWLKSVDIAKAAKACDKAGSLLVVDSTAATPILSQPISLGAHIVMHSASKAINGHSDVLAGVLCVADKSLARWQAMVTDRHDAGAIIGNFEAWLLIRGMRTLPLRVQRMCENALAVANFLNAHKKVESVLYPGLKDHQGHLLAAKQMSGGFGYLMSILVNGDGTDALKFCGALDVFHRATSLGGVESLVEHRQTIEGEGTGIPANLVRISIGIEHVDDLIGDLDQALNSIG